MTTYQEIEMWSAASANVSKTETIRKDKRSRHHRQTKKNNRIEKSDVTSPTAATESVLIIVAMDRTENQDVTVIYAPEAFLTADMYKDVIMILENEMVDAMIEIDSNLYEKYVIYGKIERSTCMFASARPCT